MDCVGNQLDIGDHRNQGSVQNGWRRLIGHRYTQITRESWVFKSSLFLVEHKSTLHEVLIKLCEGFFVYPSINVARITWKSIGYSVQAEQLSPQLVLFCLESRGLQHSRDYL